MFTASLPEYALPVVKYLDPNGYIVKVLTRQHCTETLDGLVKDLEILNIPYEKLILLDNWEKSYQMQRNNGLGIESWYEDEQDDHLEHYSRFLENIKEVDDVRDYLSNFFSKSEDF